MLDKNDFLLRKLNPKARIRPRTYAVIFRFVPCNGPFDPSSDEHLRNVEIENDLPANSIIAASWCKRPDKRSPNQTTATLKVACSSPDTANQMLTGRIRVDDHLVDVRKDLRIPLRCVKCQEYGHMQDSCIGVAKCVNCSSESHSADKCDRSPSCVSCGPSSQHPSSSPSCPSFIKKCEALDSRFPENTMPYYPSKDSWTWAASPSNPPPPREAPPPLLQPSNPNHHSVRPIRQRPQHKEVRFDIPPPSGSQERETDDGWNPVRRRQGSPQRRRQTTISDIWGTQSTTRQTPRHDEPPHWPTNQ